MAIEKTYHILLNKLVDGTITDAERWTLDKASMDDPFLADALEGYYNNKTNKESLNPPIKTNTQPKVISIRKYLSVAASLAVLFGISFWMIKGSEDQISVAHKSAELEAVEDMELDTETLKSAGEDKVVELKELSSAPELSKPKEPIKAAKREVVQTIKIGDVASKTKAEKKVSEVSEGQSQVLLDNASLPESSDDMIIAEEEVIEQVVFRDAPIKAKSKAVAQDFDSEGKAPVVVRGVVKDIDGLPVKNAFVITDKNKNSAITLSDGSFELKVMDMNQKAEVQYAGYTSETKSLKPELEFNLDKAQTSFSEPPMLLQETMTENELKQEYVNILDKTLQKQWQICKNQRDRHKKIQLRIQINEDGELDLIDYITTVNEECQIEIEDLIRRTVFERKFQGNRAVTFYYTLRF